jgi:hypothetical protein
MEIRYFSPITPTKIKTLTKNTNKISTVFLREPRAEAFFRAVEFFFRAHVFIQSFLHLKKRSRAINTKFAAFVLKR